MQNISLRSSLHGPVPPDVECSSLCGVVLSSYTVMQLVVRVDEHKMPLRAGSTAVALSVSRERALCVGCVSCSLRAAGLVPGGHPSGTACFELVCSEAESLYSSIYSVLHSAVSHGWVL